MVDDEDSTMEKEQLWRLLVQTYLLATSLGDVLSMNLTMDEIVGYVMKPRMIDERELMLSKSSSRL